MRKYVFVIDRKGIESWFPVDLEVGEKWYGGTKLSNGGYFIRAAANHHRGCYCMVADLDEATEKQLINILKDKHKKSLKKGQRFIQKVTGRSFKTDGQTLDELRKTVAYNRLVDHCVDNLQKEGAE